MTDSGDGETLDMNSYPGFTTLDMSAYRASRHKKPAVVVTGGENEDQQGRNQSVGTRCRYSMMSRPRGFSTGAPAMMRVIILSTCP